MVQSASMADRKPKPRKARWGRRTVLLAVLGFVLENIPGTYVIDEAQDEFDLDSYEGIGLLAVAAAEVDAELYFQEPALHRVSRNARIRVPADTRLTVSASMVPRVEAGEVVARPDYGEIRSNRPLTFIYRGVTVARANVLRMRDTEEGPKLQAAGRYRVLSALLTAHRYHRQKEVKRDYQPPATASMDFIARLHPEHELDFGQGLRLRTGPEPGTLRLEGARFEHGEWTAGILDLDLRFGNPQDLVNGLLARLLPEPIDFGGSFGLSIEHIHEIVFSENQLDLRVHGRMRPSGSNTLGGMFHPSFKGRLSIGFELPRDELLRDSTARLWLKNIHSLDFNRSPPVLDKMLRSALRAKREEAEAAFHFGEDLEELEEIPVEIFVHDSRIDGTPEGGPALRMRLEVVERSLVSSHKSPVISH